VYRLVGKQYTNDSLPDALNSAVEKFFADRFAYTHSLDALRSSFKKASKNSNISKFIHLPTNPYEDLLDDMLKCGIAMPSRISLAIPRKIDNGYNDALQSIEHVYDFDKMKDVIEMNRPTIADADCKLIATHKYVIDNGTDPNQELKHFISNGLKQVAIVEDDPTWIWLMAIGAVLLIVVAVVAVAFLGWTGIGIGIAVAAIALAAYAIYKVGSYAYYRMTRVVAKRTASSDKTVDFEFNVLREFNAVTIDEELMKKKQNMLLETVHDGINNLADELKNRLVDNLTCLNVYFSAEFNEIMYIPLNVIQKRIQKSYEVFMKCNKSAIEQSIKSQDVIEEVRFIIQSWMPRIESEFYAILKTELNKKPSYRRLQPLTATVYRLKEQTVHINAEVLQKIVRKTCNMLEANLLKDEQGPEGIKLSQSSELESSTMVNSDETLKNTLHGFWSQSIENRYTELVSLEISRTFREPLLRNFTAYITNYEDFRKASLISLKALDSDINAKRQHQTFEKVVQAKSQVQFLEDEVQQICTECWNMRHDTTVLYHMIIKRYPLPINATMRVETAIQKLLHKTMPDFGEFNLLLLNKEGKIMYGERKMENTPALHLTLTLHKEHFYISRNMLSEEEVRLLCFVYEGLCGICEQFGLIFHTADEFETELVNYL
jgi:hypothetical protein